MKNEELLMQGAEAKIMLSNGFIIKDRIKKSYRLKELDEKIRKSRTKKEAKLLEKASQVINAPKPISTREIYQIKMPYIQGQRLSESLDLFSLEKQKEICKRIGEEIAKLHKSDIIHGDLTTSNMILVEENEKKLKVTNLNKLLSELKKLNLPINEYAVFGGGTLAIHGIRECRDLDVIVKRNLWNKLIKKYEVTDSFKEHIKIGEIEIYKDWKPLLDNIDELIKNADILNETRFVKLKDIISLKEIQNREKDNKDINLIKEYLKKENIDFQIFFIDFGLGYISKKIEDKAVDLHLFKQAMEAKHFKNWQILFNEVLNGYKKYKDSAKVLERFKAVEKRGRYKEH